MSSPASLLLVEDDPATSELMCRLLAARGWRVIAAATVAQAIESLDDCTEVMILDLDLPDGAGESVLRFARESGRAARVVVCSACTDRERLVQLQQWNPHAVLHKPVDIEAVYAACGG